VATCRQGEHCARVAGRRLGSSWTRLVCHVFAEALGVVEVLCVGSGWNRLLIGFRDFRLALERRCRYFFCGSRAPCMFTGRQCRISSSLGDVHLSIGAPRMFIPSMFFFGRERVHSQMRPGCVSVFPPFRLDSPLSLWLSISCLSYQDCAIGACIVKNSTPAARSCPRTPPLTDVFWQGCTQFVVQVASVRPRLITSA